MFEDIQAAIPMGFILSFMIGPVFFVLLETSVIKGFRAALVFDLGVIVADSLFLLIAYFSSYQLLEDLSNQPGLYVFGGAILVVYGLTIVFKKGNGKQGISINEASKNNYPGLFVKGFLLNFINIGVLVFWLGAIIVIGPTLNNDSDRLITFFGAMLGAYLLTDIGKILLAKQLKSKLTPVRIAMTKKILGFILIACGVFLMIKGFLPKDQLDIEKGIERMEQIRE